MEYRNEHVEARPTLITRSTATLRALALGSALAVTLGAVTAPEVEARPFSRVKATAAKVVKKAPKPFKKVLDKAGGGPFANVVAETLDFGRDAAGDMWSEFNAFSGGSCGTGSPCRRFSDGFVAMLDDVQYLLGLVPVKGIDGERLRRLRDRVNNGDIRPFVLFLVHRALGEDPAVFQVPERVIAIAEEIAPKVLTSASEFLVGAPDDPYNFCGRLLVKDPAMFKVHKARLGMIKPTLAITSVVLKAVPDIDIGGEGGIAVANVQGNITIKVGPMFDVVNKGISLIVDQIKATMDLELAKYEACNAS